jgi:hypothetical protein
MSEDVATQRAGLYRGLLPLGHPVSLWAVLYIPNTLQTQLYCTKIHTNQMLNYKSNQ